MTEQQLSLEPASHRTLPYLQSSQVAYRKERLRWLSAGGRTWGRGGLELCSQATHTPALGKVVLWAVGSKLARGAFPAQVSPHVGSYQVRGPSGQNAEAWSCHGWWPSREQGPDLATAPGLGLQIHTPFFSPLPWEADFYGLIKGLRLPSGFQLDLVSERHCGRWESEKRLGFYSLLPSFCGLHLSTKGYSSFRKPSLYPLWDPLLLPLLDRKSVV